jgi:hypothetical protein
MKIDAAADDDPLAGIHQEDPELTRRFPRFWIRNRHF